MFCMDQELPIGGFRLLVSPLLWDKGDRKETQRMHYHIVSCILSSLAQLAAAACQLDFSDIFPELFTLIGRKQGKVHIWRDQNHNECLNFKNYRKDTLTFTPLNLRVFSCDVVAAWMPWINLKCLHFMVILTLGKIQSLMVPDWGKHVDEDKS